MRIGFFVWNPFQIYQFASVAAHCADPVYILQRKKNVDFDQLFPREFLDGLGAEVVQVMRNGMGRLDGVCDALVCQTAFPLMENLRRTKVVSMQYSMSKERHQYGAWRLLCDLNLVYGAYSRDRVAPYGPCVMVGNPRFDRWFEDRLDPAQVDALRARLDPAKKTVLYLPTWGRLSSMTEFGRAVAELGERYNVIAKVHHKTDSHELARKTLLGADGIRNLFGAADDLLVLLRAADVVLSDYSGAIFDAIHVGKPVVLLQSDPQTMSEAGAEKFGLESIEYARRDMIGPVLSSPRGLAETVAGVLAGSIDFSEPNRRLKAECFARERGCGQAAADAIRDFLVRGGEPRAYYQVYARDLIRGYRQAEEEQARLRGSGCGRRLLRLAWCPVRLVLGPPERRARLAGLPGRLAGWVLGPAARTIERLVARRAAERPGESLSGAAGLAARLLPVRRLVTLARRCEEPAPAPARDLARLAFDRDAPAGLGPYMNILLHQGRRDEAERLMAVIAAMPVETRFRLQSRLERLRESLGAGDELARRSRHEVHLFLMTRLARDGMAKSARRANEDMLRVLAANRWLADAMSFVNIACAGETVRAAVRAADRTARERMEDWFCLTEVANANQRPGLAPAEYRCLRGGRVEPVGEGAGGEVLEFFLPPYFFSATVTEPGVHARICRLLRRLLDRLERRGTAVVPRHQFRLAEATPSGHWPALSYHTAGDRPGWWHLKDGPLPGTFSLDRLGYAGWSSLAREPLAGLGDPDRERADAQATWERLGREVVAAGRSKYVQSEAPFSPPAEPYVFLPLQVVGDTVARLAHIPVLRLLDLLAEALPRHGYVLVVKRHPKCRDPRVGRALSRLAGQGRIRLTEASVHAVLPGCAAVVTVNSGVGFEALLHGKRVVATGGSDYGPAVTTVADAAGLEAALDGLAQPVDLEALRLFVHRYVTRYLFDPEDDDALDARLEAVLASRPGPDGA